MLAETVIYISLSSVAKDPLQWLQSLWWQTKELAAKSSFATDKWGAQARGKCLLRSPEEKMECLPRNHGKHAAEQPFTRCYKCSHRTQQPRFDSFSFTMHSYLSLLASLVRKTEKKLHKVPALPHRLCQYTGSIRTTRTWELSDNTPSDNHILPIRLCQNSGTAHY